MSCTPSGAANYEEAVAEFVAEWGQAAVLCEQLAVCMVGVPGPCEAVSRPAEVLVQGVHHAHFDINAIARCQDSAAIFGTCVGTLDCTTLSQADVLCAPERERYIIDCAGLLAALDYIDGDGAPSGGAAGSGGGAGSGGAPSGGASGQSQGVLTAVLCERAQTCTGVRWSAEQTAACASQSALLFGPLIPDPAGTKACVETGPCEELVSDSAGFVAGCVDLDLASIKCADMRGIDSCTSAGICSLTACRDFCASLGAITLGCGPSPSGGGDTCQCG